MESLNARYRRAVRARALPHRTGRKCLYLVTRSLDPKGSGARLPYAALICTPTVHFAGFRWRWLLVGVVTAASLCSCTWSWDLSGWHGLGWFFW